MVRSFAMAWIAFAAVASAVGCELAIRDTIPAFTCDPGGTDTCPSNSLCVEATHECMLVSDTCQVTGCRGNTQCDSTTWTCEPFDGSVADSPDSADSAPETAPKDASEAGEDSKPTEAAPPDSGPCRSLGCICSGASDCDSEICADSLAVTPALYTAAGDHGFCTAPCCSSADCSASTVCFGTGQGGNYCVEPAWLGRSAAVGTTAGGGSCTRGADCRSGLCSLGGSCADSCCSTTASTCTGGSSCGFSDFPGAASLDKNYGAHCESSGGSGQNGDNCGSNNDCESSLCAADPFGGMSCTNACRASSNCESGEACVYLLPPNQSATPAPVAAACLESQGNLSFGASCSPSNDKCSGFCNPGTDTCTTVCFADSDCPSGVHCRPDVVAVSGGGSYEVLICGS